MAQREAVYTDKAPKPLPQFSQAIKYNGMVYCSGNIGMDPATSKIVDGTVQDRTRQALKNLSAILQEAGSSFQNVVKLNIFLTDMQDFAPMNEVYDEFFAFQPKPCRTCVAVHQLPLGTDVEIECTAAILEGSKI
ncbi:Endoribonuclease L-PSP/chorismate mutase-like protein [Podospora didyma]|uniref:Endoribonuclease L-PSP/chorismate mutase-like protein n=1 Tax=Podospora didyma TaxID=330526 RepID=A0AAE0NP23_9PEZI|nr:Endoribonuclease L-PSP/chorismate mutase-like protein [Podospora didyma]